MSGRRPRGYRYALGGEAESSAEAFGGIGTAIIVAVFGIFAILVLEFGNFKSTLNQIDGLSPVSDAEDSVSSFP